MSSHQLSSVAQSVTSGHWPPAVKHFLGPWELLGSSFLSAVELQAYVPTIITACPDSDQSQLAVGAVELQRVELLASLNMSLARSTLPAAGQAQPRGLSLMSVSISSSDGVVRLCQSRSSAPTLDVECGFRASCGKVLGVSQSALPNDCSQVRCEDILSAAFFLPRATTPNISKHTILSKRTHIHMHLRPWK